ncbi:MAG TPA: TonB-dependent receptor plug domain-containing protein, partial [Steroidobacteraceae bacterium]
MSLGIHCREPLLIAVAAVLAAMDANAQTAASVSSERAAVLVATAAATVDAGAEGRPQTDTSAAATAAPADSPPAPEAKSDTPGNDSVAEVLVTGSRVIKNGNDSPTPVTVINVQDMALVHPGTVADQLNDLPQFAGSRGQLTNPGGGAQGTSSAATNPAANVLNLRNFGYTRTLVLFDGHRLAPTAPDGTVDTNMIPQMLLQRVDVVTGGASAVYGSDAVTGVVNFITDTHFNGVKAEARAGVSYYGDEVTEAGGLAGGTDLFGGRGHIEASIQTQHDP